MSLPQAYSLYSLVFVGKVGLGLGSSAFFINTVAILKRI